MLCHPSTSHFCFEYSTLGWACGYNNAQVLLSYLKQTMPNEFRTAFGERVPSIHKLQTMIEEGWQKGIDPEGSAQLRTRIVNTRKWIGTTEIYTFLTSGSFRYILFEMPLTGNRCLVHDFNIRSPPYVDSLVKYVDEYFKGADSKFVQPSTSRCAVTNRAPLYLQHSGHSRSIVGIEHLTNGKINLLLFDPGRKPSAVVKNLANGKVEKIKDLSDKLLKPYRVSIEDIKKRKEYQILRCATVRHWLTDADCRME